MRFHLPLWRRTYIHVYTEERTLLHSDGGGGEHTYIGGCVYVGLEETLESLDWGGHWRTCFRVYMARLGDGIRDVPQQLGGR